MSNFWYSPISNQSILFRIVEKTRLAYSPIFTRKKSFFLFRTSALYLPPAIVLTFNSISNRRENTSICPLLPPVYYSAA